jgi:tetratricopeptide (TPR) repeat protein
LTILAIATIAWFIPAIVHGQGIDETYIRPKGTASFSDFLLQYFRSSDFDKSYAIVVGVGDYSEYEKLSAPAQDAVRVRDFLRDRAGFDHIILLTDDKATRTRIENLMEQWFPERTQRNDRFFFYFSGHGETRTFSNGNKRGYLVLQSSAKRQWDSMVDMPRIRQWAENIGHSKHSLFLLDACFSGLAAFQTADGTRDKTISRLTQPFQQIVTAGVENEKSYSFSGASLFTSAFLSAASSEGDTPGDAIVSLTEIMTRINKALDQKRAELGDSIKMSPHRWDTRTTNNAGDYFFIKQRVERAEQHERERSPIAGAPNPPVQSKGGEAASQARIAYREAAASLRRREYDSSLAELNRAIEVEPDFAEAYALRGKVRIAKRSRDAAYADIDNRLKEFFESGDWEKSTNSIFVDLNEAVRLDHGLVEGYLYRGAEYRLKRDFDRAIADLSEAIRLDPNLATAHLERGRVHLAKNEFDRAIEDFKKATYLDPESVEAHADLGTAYKLNGDLDRAMISYQQATSLNPKGSSAQSGVTEILNKYMSTGEKYATDRRFSEAIEQFTKAIRWDQGFVSALVRRGEVHLQSGHFDNAIYDLNLAIQREPSRASSYATRGEAYRRKGDFGRAVADYTAALAIDPRQPTARSGMNQISSRR